MAAITVVLSACDAAPDEPLGDATAYCADSKQLRADLAQRWAAEMQRDVPGEDPAAKDRRYAAVIVAFHRDNKSQFTELQSAAPRAIDVDVFDYWEAHRRAGEESNLALLRDPTVQSRDSRIKRWEHAHCEASGASG